ncbi:MAG: polyphenol oxidase family protein [Acidimicrobiales bacterium]
MPVDVTLSAQRRGSLPVLVPDAIVALGVDAFVTSRAGGVSAPPYDSLNLADHVGDDPSCVTENRRRVADAAGVAPTHLVTVRQVHGADVVVIDGPASDLDADAMVTEDPRVALAVLVADCVPVLVVDPAAPRWALVHAGWRGLAAGVLGRALAAFDRPASLHVLLGPSISAARYQVGPEVSTLFSHVPGALAPDVGDRSRLDLRRVATVDLVSRGVRDDQIYVTREVTDDADRFFSDRARRPCGRFALVARGPSMRAP